MSNALTLYQDPAAHDHQAVGMPYYPAKRSGVRFYVITGIFMLFALVGGSAYWSMTAKLDGAVIAPASFVVESNRKTVQHLEGGIVRELLVQEGDYVEADQVLLRMDNTDNEVNVDVLSNQLAELHVRRARLRSELTGAETFLFDPKTDPVVGELSPQAQETLLLVQKGLFDEQVKARKSEAQVIEQRIQRFEKEIAGLTEQRAANQEQFDIIAEEIKTFEDLLAQQLTSVSRVNALKRERQRLRGEDAEFATAQLRAGNQIDELKLEMIRQQRTRRETVATELATVETQVSAISPQYFGAIQRLKRVAVRAPVSGRIVDMKIYTVGGVVRPGADILDIVPESDDLVVEARVATSDIEKLRVGQETRVRLTAFDQTEIPEAIGQIAALSADSLTDERSGSSYYLARVRLNTDQPGNVSDLDFVPGMPADVFINTGERTALSYLLQPFNDRLVRTFVQ